MDVGMLASAFVAAHTATLQLAFAAAMMRADMQAEMSVVDVLDAAQQNARELAALSPGVGGALDVSV